MIIVRAPYRVSFFGGGTDYPAWYEKHGGAVLSATLHRYCYVTLRRSAFLGAKYRVVWSQTELVDDIENIVHPAVRACLRFRPVETPEGLEIMHFGDLPARSGLGSSSSFTVALLRGLYAMRGNHIPLDALASDAIYVERNLLGETVGIQDQIAACYGGIRAVSISRDGTFRVEPLTVSTGILSLLSSRLLLFHTGTLRTASDIAASQVVDFPGHSDELHALGGLVPKAIACLSAEQLDDFGMLLNEAWMLKRSLSERVSLPEIDYAYAAAREAGALGGKLLGAGGGGFLLFYVPEKSQVGVRSALSNLIEVPFGLGREGVRVLIHE